MRLIKSLGLILLIVLNINSWTKSTADFYVVKRGKIERKISIIGVLEPENVINIKAKVSGDIVKLFVKENDYVKKGEILCQIESDIQKTKLEKIKLQLEDLSLQVKLATVNLEKVSRDFKRKKILFSKKLISKEEFLQSSEEVAIADLKLKELLVKKKILMQDLNEAKEELDFTKVYSPVDAVVAKVLVNEGDTVSGVKNFNAGTLLFILASLKSKIVAYVSEQDIVYLKNGARVNVQIGNKKFLARVKKIYRWAVNHDFKAIIEGNYFKVEMEIVKSLADDMQNNRVINNEIPPYWGLTAYLDLLLDKKENVLIVPRVYLLFKKGKAFVKLKNGELKEVKIGIVSDFKVEIVDGIKEGDVLVYPENVDALLKKMKKRKIENPFDFSKKKKKK